MDNKFTEKIQKWLNAMPEEQNVQEGALMLLQLNRNRVLYNNILRNPTKLKDKLVYELQKHLNIRLDGLTLDAVRVMDKQVTAKVAKVVKPEAEAELRKGMRADHNSLPEEVRNLFDEAHDLMIQMRSVHERLKVLNTARPCDRYPYLKQLLKMYDRYRECYNKYDTYGTPDWRDDAEAAPVDAATVEQATAATAKAIGTYRGFVVTNIKKLQELIAKGKEEKAERLREKMQDRYNQCKEASVAFSDETIDALNALGIE